MTLNLARTRLADYDVLWGTYDLGSVDKVTPDLQVKTAPIKVGSVGDTILGQRVIALEGTIKVEAREIDRTLAAAMMPWSGSGAIPLIPGTVNQDLYAYAAVLVLHPTDVAAGTTTEDITLIKAVPTIQWMDRDGVKDDKAVITFMFFPDRSQLPIKSYGYIGPSPS